MTPTKPFSITSLTRGLPGLAELDTLLDSNPLPALLVHGPTQCVVAMNAGLAELSGYTRTELRGMLLKDLFTDWGTDTFDRRLTGQEPKANSDARGQQLKDLKKRDGRGIGVWLKATRLPPEGTWGLISLEPIQSRKQQQIENKRLKQLAENLRSLASTPQEEDSETALYQALKAGSAITGAGGLAVYLVSENSPGLNRRATWGAAQGLPETLPSQDLMALHAPQLWEAGKRTPSTLHRAAHTAKLAYMASSPLGQPHAIIGLVVATDQNNAAPENVLALLQILAETVTSIIQHEMMLSRMRESLREQKRALLIAKTIEAGVQEGLVILSPRLTTLAMNTTAETILGYTSREVRGQPVENILIGNDKLMPALQAAQQGSPTYKLGENRLYRRDGQAFSAHLRTLPVMDAEGLQAVVVVIQDLSEQEQIREQSEQLAQHAVLGEVMAVFAHEVRNPINNISTGLQLMALNLPEDDSNQEAILRLQQDCDRLAELMKSVLSFSRPTDFQMEMVDLKKLLQRLLDRLQPRMTRSGIQSRLQVESDCPLITGNPRALEQVFINLMNNALQAMNEGGGSLTLKVQTLQAPGQPAYVEVSVADTGPGIPAEFAERLFQPFFTTHQNGTGLGLPIAKRIITAHRGTIRVTSVPGGTVFLVQLPMAEPLATESP